MFRHDAKKKLLSFLGKQRNRGQEQEGSQTALVTENTKVGELRLSRTRNKRLQEMTEESEKKKGGRNRRNTFKARPHDETGEWGGRGIEWKWTDK